MAKMPGQDLTKSTTLNHLKTEQSQIILLVLMWYMLVCVYMQVHGHTQTNTYTRTNTEVCHLHRYKILQCHGICSTSWGLRTIYWVGDSLYKNWALLEHFRVVLCTH